MIQARFAPMVMLALLTGHSFGLAQSRVQREIIPVKGDPYRCGNGGDFSAFLVTPVGFAATDRVDAEAARWLTAELAKRRAKPGSFLIYSHDHADHILGREICADRTTVIAHDLARAKLAAPGRRVRLVGFIDCEQIRLQIMKFGWGSESL